MTGPNTVSGNGDMPRAQAAACVAADTTVRLRYELELPGGVVVDAAGADDPLEFRCGDGMLDAVLERALLGRECGPHRIEFEPGAVFGWPDPVAVQVVPRSQFPADLPLQVNRVVRFDLPTGEAIPGRIEEIHEDAVIVDFNHPLAGRAFTFAVEIDAIWRDAAAHDDRPGDSTLGG